MGVNEKKLSSGHTVDKIPDEEAKRIRKNFPKFGDMVRLNPGGWFFEECAPAVLERIYNFEYKPTDVLLMAYPKCGITWTQEIIWSFLFNPNLDNPDAATALDFRSPHIDGDLFIKIKNAPKLGAGGNVMRDAIRKVDPIRVNDPDLMFTYTELGVQDPRLIKTHLPMAFFSSKLLETSKLIYVARDPRDVINSRFSFIQLSAINDYKGSFDDYIDHFLNDEILFNPYWLHLKEAWDLRHHPNMLFIFYEDMISDPVKIYKKFNEFLGTNRSEQQVKNIIDYTNFKNMKSRNEAGTVQEPMSDEGIFYNSDVKKRTGGFFRKGQSGGWTDAFTPEVVVKINNWIKESTKDFPSDFPYLNKE